MQTKAGILTEEQFRKYLERFLHPEYIPPYLDPQKIIKLFPKEECNENRKGSEAKRV